MISKGPHLRDQPAEQRTHLTNELLNISPSLSCRLLFSFSLCIHYFWLVCLYFTNIFKLIQLSYAVFFPSALLFLCHAGFIFAVTEAL